MKFGVMNVLVDGAGTRLTAIADSVMSLDRDVCRVCRELSLVRCVSSLCLTLTRLPAALVRLSSLAS